MLKGDYAEAMLWSIWGSRGVTVQCHEGNCILLFYSIVPCVIFDIFEAPLHIVVAGQETLSFFKTRTRRIYFICYCQSFLYKRPSRYPSSSYLQKTCATTFLIHLLCPSAVTSIVPFSPLTFPSPLAPQVAKHTSTPSKLSPQVEPPLHHIPPTSVRLPLHPPYPYLPHQRASHIKGHGPCIPYLRAKRED